MKKYRLCIIFLIVLSLFCEAVLAVRVMQTEMSAMGIPPVVALVGDRQITSGFSREGKMVTFFYPSVGAYDFVPYYTEPNYTKPLYGAPEHLGASLGIVDLVRDDLEELPIWDNTLWLTDPSLPRPTLDHSDIIPAFTFTYPSIDSKFFISYRDLTIKTTVFSPRVTDEKLNSVVYECTATNPKNTPIDVGIAYYAAFDPSEVNQDPYLNINNSLIQWGLGSITGWNGFKVTEGPRQIVFKDNRLIWKNQYYIGFTSNLTEVLYADFKEIDPRSRTDRGIFQTNYNVKSHYSPPLPSVGEYYSATPLTENIWNGIIIWNLHIPSKSEKTFRIVVAADSSRDQLDLKLSTLSQTNDNIISKTANWWQNDFLTILHDNPYYKKLTSAQDKKDMDWWVMTLALMADNNTGAIIAAPLLIPKYYGSWPRDGVMQTLAWDALGYKEISEKYFKYLFDLSDFKNSNGLWFQCYSSVQQGEYVGLPASYTYLGGDILPVGLIGNKVLEEDQMGIVLMGLWYYNKTFGGPLPVSNSNDVVKLANHLDSSIENNNYSEYININRQDIFLWSVGLIPVYGTILYLVMPETITIRYSVKGGLIRPSSDAYEFPGNIVNELGKPDLNDKILHQPDLIALRQSHWTNFWGSSALLAASELTGEASYKITSDQLHKKSEEIFYNPSDGHFYSSWSIFAEQVYDRSSDNGTAIAWPIQAYPYDDSKLLTHNTWVDQGFQSQVSGEKEFFTAGLLQSDIYHNIAHIASPNYMHTLESAIDYSNGYFPEQVVAIGNNQYEKVVSAEPLGWVHANAILDLLTREGYRPPILQDYESNEWSKCFGGSLDDEAQSIQETTDGGYIIVGTTKSNDGNVSGNHGNRDYWVVKLSDRGSIQWQKCLGGSLDDEARSIQQTADGGYIVVGTAKSNDGNVSGNHGNRDYWVVKLSDQGSIQWQKCLGGSSDEEAQSIQETTDGGYIIAGWTNSNEGDVSGNHGNRDYWVVKLSDQGSIQWQKCLGGSSDDEAYSIQKTTNGGFIVAGTTYSNNGNVSGNHGNPDFWVIKLSDIGDIIWQKCLGGSSSDRASSIQQTTDGGYVVSGVTSSNDGNVSGNHISDFGYLQDFWVVKLSDIGDIIWQKCLGGSYDDWASKVQQTTDGGYIIAGVTCSNDGNVSGNHGPDFGEQFLQDFWVVKLSNNGNIQSQKSLGGSSFDLATDIDQTTDGGYIVAGMTSSNDGNVSGNHGYNDYWVIKLNESSFFPCPSVTDLHSTTVLPNSIKWVWSYSSNANIAKFLIYLNGVYKTELKITSSSLTSSFTATSLLPDTYYWIGVKTVDSKGNINPTWLNHSAYTTAIFYLPTISSISPTNIVAWSHGFTLTVSGTNYNTQSIVYWNGVEKTTTFISPTTVTAEIPDEDLITSGNVNVWVVNHGPIIGKTKTLTLTIKPIKPTIDSFSLAEAYVGGPQCTLTIKGQNFTSGSTVKWNGVAKTTLCLSAEKLNATIPATDLISAKIVNITVTNPGVLGPSNTVQFQIVYGTPNITNVIPSTISAGGAAFSLTVMGTNFTAASKVQWNGVNKTTTLASGKLIASIPKTDIASPGTVNVTIVNPGLGGGTSVNTPFAVANPQPTITRLTPTTTISGSSTFNLTVTGTNFTSTSRVYWDSTTRQTWYVTSTSLKASILAGDIATTKTVNVSIYNPSDYGDMKSTNTTFSVTNGLPTATSLSPAIVPKGNPDTNVTITGTNFNTQSQIYWNGATTGWSTYFINGTRMNLTVPAAFFSQTTGTTAKVQVFNPTPGGGKSTNQTLTIGQPLPIITSLNPVEGSVGAPGLSLRVVGTDFVAGSKVYWNGIAKTPTVSNITSTLITLWIPATDLATARDNLVKVQNPTPGSPMSNQVTFPVKNPVPGITSISPTSTKAGGAAFALTVNGNNFTKTSKVQWNGLNKTTTFSVGKLTASILATDITRPGTVNVIVYNPSPGGGTSANLPFIIQNPQPSLTSITPTTKVHGSAAFNLTLTGTNFTAASKVQWNGENRTTCFTSATSLKAWIEATDIISTGTNQVRVLNPAGTGDLVSGNKVFSVT